MSGAGLIAIRRRIKSVTNTRKITKAMGLVATSKLRKAREKLVIAEEYHKHFQDVINALPRGEQVKSRYISGDKNSPVLYICITSDSGLCGGYNAQVVAETIRVMHEDDVDSALMVLGQKGRIIFKKLKFETVAEYVELSDMPSLKEAKEIAEQALNLFDKGEVGAVKVVYTHLYSTVRQEVEVVNLLPLLEVEQQEGSYVELEPSGEELINSVVYKYMTDFMLNCMLHAKASEQSARMSSMDSATKNANDLIQDLNLKYNRVRQSAITQEISEIVGGAEAQR